MSGDIVAFIRARLDEDEAVARKAAGVRAAFGVWHVEPWYDGTGERCDIRAGAAGDLTAHGGLELVIAEHFVRHDPARVLREVEAKRRLLDHVWRYEERIDQDRGCCCDWEKIAAGLCQETPLARIDALRDFAVAWSDHPDYRQEWAP